MIDDPYEAWERRPGRRTGQRKRDAKLEELQREYQQAYDSAVAVVLTRWGFRLPLKLLAPASAGRTAPALTPGSRPNLVVPLGRQQRLAGRQVGDIP
jgi:hypothetical protein